MSTVSNVLNASATAAAPYHYHLGLDAVTGITGVLVCICDKLYDAGTLFQDAWKDILARNGANDSVVYVMTATKGTKRLTYVGKTLNRLVGRYPHGPTGGLKLVTDIYASGGATLECTLYNVSHPALVELWCYQVLVDRKYALANTMDPS